VVCLQFLSMLYFTFGNTIMVVWEEFYFTEKLLSLAPNSSSYMPYIKK
jgi:hypothetical protein